MQTNKVENDKPKNKVFFCWNTKDHKNTFAEYTWEQEYIKNKPVKCPICHQYHKVTMRMGDGQ
jgi:ssDNA-binding Zn-finger/Zn-ribbon topoisomerase 1